MDSPACHFPLRHCAKVHFVEHHLAHISSAFYVSPFEKAAVMSLDGFGDMVSAMWGVGRGAKVRIMGEVGFPHSLGLFYTAFTQYLGFPNYGDEYKVMGLASYGEPEYLEAVREVVARVCADLGETFDEVDVDADPDLADRFGDEVPVTFVDGRQHDFWRVDETRLRAALITR